MRLIKNYYSEYRDENNKLLLFLSIDIVEENLEFISENFHFIKPYFDFGCPIIHLNEHQEIEYLTDKFTAEIAHIGFIAKNNDYQFDENIDKLFMNLFEVLKLECLQKKLTIPPFLLLDNGDFNCSYFDNIVGYANENKWLKFIRTIEANSFVSLSVNCWLYAIYSFYFKSQIENIKLEKVTFQNLFEKINDVKIVNNLLEVYTNRLEIFELTGNNCYILKENKADFPIAFVNLDQRLQDIN